MNYYITETTTVFYDGHGVADFGGTEYSVEHTDEYDDLDLSKTYTEDLEEVSDNEDNYAQDGYNCEETQMRIRKITEDEYDEFSYILKQYQTLIHKFK